MANQQLVDYIKGQMAAGVLKPDLEKAVASAGWSAADASAAFAAAEGKVPPPPMPTVQRAPMRTNVIEIEPRRSLIWLWMPLTIALVVVVATATYYFLPAVREVVGFYLGQAPAPAEEAPYVPPLELATSTASTTPQEGQTATSTATTTP